MPAMLAFPVTLVSPMSPVIVIGSLPCGVSASKSMRSDLPVTVPAMAMSPAGPVIVPLIFSPSCFMIAVAGISPIPAITSLMSHLPLRSLIGVAPAVPALPATAGAAATAAAAAAVGAAAVAAVRFPVNGNSPKSPTLTLPVISSPATLPSMPKVSAMP